MCFYDLHVSSHAQQSILMCYEPQKIDRQLLVEKKIQNWFIIHNKFRNVKYITQLKQLKPWGAVLPFIPDFWVSIIHFDIHNSFLAIQ